MQSLEYGLHEFSGYPQIRELKETAFENQATGMRFMPLTGDAAQLTRLTSWMMDPAIVVRYFPYAPATRDIAAAHLSESIRDPEAVLYEIGLSGRSAGLITFNRFDAYFKAAFTSLLVAPDLRGQHVGLEAAFMRAAIAKQFGLKRLMLEIHRENEAPLRILRHFPHDGPAWAPKSEFVRYIVYLDRWNPPPQEFPRIIVVK